MFNPIINTITISNGIIGVSAGLILMMPSLMAFDAAPNVKPSMVLLGCSGMSVIPITIVATTMSLITNDLGYQSLYMIPTCGMGIGAITDGIINLLEDMKNPQTEPPLVEQPLVEQPASLITSPDGGQL